MKYPLLILFLFLFFNGLAQDFTPNYDESKIPEYEIPALRYSKNGTKINTSEQWKNIRRNEILNDFEEYVYGIIPKGKVEIKTELIKEMDAFDGKATMKEVKMTFTKKNKSISMDILIYLPKSQGKVPLFVGLNFFGNHTIIDDPNVSLASGWVRNNDEFGITENKATEASRGVRHNRWAVEKIIDRGYGLATIYYGDIDPDKNDFTDGIQSLFYKKGQTQPAKSEWGSIAGWAWGLSRAMDYFEEDTGIDETKIALMGHSRLGKASLWAGASDQRFAIVISNDSGCGGAALSRRRIGETVGRINTSFPHWFNDNFNKYNNNEDALPVDQHMLIALVAPRPVYVASAEKDKWADPKGEFISAYLASEVYTIFGLEGLPSDKMPELNQPIQKSVGYHIRSVKHDVTDFDWEAYLNFADLHFGK
jgi:hypothetical protein